MDIEMSFNERQGFPSVISLSSLLFESCLKSCYKGPSETMEVCSLKDSAT